MLIYKDLSELQYIISDHVIYLEKLFTAIKTYHIKILKINQGSAAEESFKYIKKNILRFFC